MSTRIRLLLVRHGQSVWHDPNRYAGSSDIALDEVGVQQAEQLRGVLEAEEPSVLVSSPLTRARHTVEPYARSSGLPWVEDERLREVDFGSWEGKTLEELRRADPGQVERFRADPITDYAPGGEPPDLAVQRAMEFFADATQRWSGERVAVVFHNTLLRLCLCSWLGIPPRDYRRRLPRVRNVAITEVELNPDGAALIRFNDRGRSV